MKARSAIAFLVCIGVAFGMMGQSGPIDPWEGPLGLGCLEVGTDCFFECKNGATAGTHTQCNLCLPTDEGDDIPNCVECCGALTKANTIERFGCCTLCDDTNSDC